MQPFPVDKRNDYVGDESHCIWGITATTIDNLVITSWSYKLQPKRYDRLEIKLKIMTVKERLFSRSGTEKYR